MDGVAFGTGSLTGDKLLVIIDYPGKGKSWLLTSLSNRFLDNWPNQPNHLLIRVNLREIKDWGKHSDSDGLAFILANLKASIRGDMMTESSADSLTLAILHRMYHHDPPSIFVLLDGYDEIDDCQRRRTRLTTDARIKAKGIKRVILTSRPESTLENELEKHFKQFSLHLKNFERDDQIKYMKKRWTWQLAGKPLILLEGQQERIIETYAKGLVDFASRVLKDENSKTFLDIPLQCWIFSECFFQQLVQYLKRCSDDSPGGETHGVPRFYEENFNVLSLYDRFYEAKIDVLLNEKANIPLEGNEALAFLRSVLSECFIGSTVRLSTIYMMKNRNEGAAVLANFQWDAYRRKVMKKYRHHDEGASTSSSEYDEDLKRAMKLGVVQQDECASSDMKPQDIRFLHRTFAEYFFARGLLMSSFVRQKSELLEMNARFEIVTGKILFAEELAGVRRFLDSMLASYLPFIIAKERCPFSASGADRTGLLNDWPVLGHERFNEHLAETVVAHHEAGRSHDEEAPQHQTGLLKSINMSYLEDFTHTASMLIHCIKEYICRAGTCDETRLETLTSSFMRYRLACLLASANTNTRKGDHETKSRIVITSSSLLGWFDRAPLAPVHVSDALTKRFFELINGLIREKSSKEYPALGSVIASTCKRLSHHSEDKDFDDEIYAIVSLMLSNNKTESVEAFQFFRVNLFVPVDLFDDENRLSDALFQGMLVSLAERDVLSSVLLERLAQAFVSTLKPRVEQLAGQPADEAGHDDAQAPASVASVIESSRKLLDENILHPKALMKAVEFFASSSRKLSEATLAELIDVALDYVTKIQLRLFEMSHCVDLLFATRVDESNSSAVTCKMTSTFHMFYYLLASDMVISQIRDAGERKEAMLNVFITELGQKSLTAYAYAKCCCNCNHLWFTGFGVHLPRKMPALPANGDTSERQDDRFERFFSDLLSFLWTEKGEVEFIDFLLLK